MRKRDLRKLREQHNRERWRDLWIPADVASADEAWKDAIAENKSLSNELEAMNYRSSRERSAKD